MKKIYFLQKLRRMLHTYSDYEFIFVVPGGTIRGTVLFEQELQNIRLTNTDNMFHMASIPIGLTDDYIDYFTKTSLPYTSPYSEEDGLVLENVTLNFGNKTTKLESLLIFTEEIVAFSIVKKS